MSYEFKLFLDSKQVLTEERKPLQQVAGLSFSLKDNMQIYLLDTPELKLYETGWIVRSRFKDEKWELTYKRRIKDYRDLDSAMEQANNEGFTLGEYELEVEWGYKKKALSLARDFDIELEGKPREVWKQLILDKAPKPFQRTDLLEIKEDGHVMGAVQSGKYRSKWGTERVHLEIWSIGADCMAEATMKIENATEVEAADKHQRFITLFQEANVLLEQDMSKTRWALEKLKQAYTPQTTH